jgi:outer membrane lipoprotein-sorting protein
MKALILFALSLLMFACSSGESDSRDETIGKEIADDYNAAMNKAENVEALMQEQKEKMDEALKNAQDP